MGFFDRLQHGWNAFMNRDPTNFQNFGVGYSYRPDRPRLTRGNERSIVTSVYNRIALDVAAINIKHCRLDENNRFISIIEQRVIKEMEQLQIIFFATVQVYTLIFMLRNIKLLVAHLLNSLRLTALWIVTHISTQPTTTPIPLPSQVQVHLVLGG